MKRQYLTYTRIFDKLGNNKIDPQPLMNERWGSQFSFRETWASGHSLSDPRFIAVMDYEEEKRYLVDKCVDKDGLFEFTFVDEAWIIKHMNEWYGENNWEFNEENIFKDLRKTEELV